jgi:hypothetical protein
LTRAIAFCLNFKPGVLSLELLWGQFEEEYVMIILEQMSYFRTNWISRQ